MAENKFIKHLKGTATAGAVLEVKNQGTPATFGNMPSGTSNLNTAYADARGDATGVLKGTDNWKLNGSTLTLATQVYGDGRDLTGTYTASGSSLWVNAIYTFDSAKIFSPNTKWVLKLCGANLLSAVADTINFSLIIKFGSTPLVTKTFTVAEQANNFSQQFVIDFNEWTQNVLKATSGDTLTIQLLCGDSTASATIYNGMTTLTALQRRVDGDVVASDTSTFDDLEQDVKNLNDEVEQIQEDLGDLEEYVDDTFVRLDGNSTMTGPLKMRATSSFQCAIAPFWDGVGFYKLNSDDSVTLIASIDTPDGFLPWTTNTYNIGSSLKKWKNLYLAGKAYVPVINNGYDIAVPVTNSADTLALKSEVDLAANSGRMITDQGLWYAKMYSATVAPSAEDGTNYADFSQTDGQGNPIIVTYNRVNGAWVQDQTITPPAEYDGYVPITSKIWDIAEQAGQQGGRILWNHQSKDFTPYPQIISFEDAALTGNSTVAMPLNPTNDNITNKGYVDGAITAAIGNGTITFMQGDEVKGTITANQTTNTTITLDEGGSTQSVGNVFWTMRTDNELNGAVECNGATYDTTDFTGAQSIGQLLAGGKVPYVSLAQYATLLSTQGSCGVFGWDGVGTTSFRVPMLRDIFVETGTAAQIGDYLEPAIPNIKYNASYPTIGGSNGALTIGARTGSYVGPASSNNVYFYPNNVNASTVSSVYKDTADTVQPKAVRYRPMVQLAVGATDEALETCTGVLADVADLKDHRVIAFQAPTADNNYTWYRKYADGWVEQGGQETHTTSSMGAGTTAIFATVTFPVALTQITGMSFADNMTFYNVHAKDESGTGMTIKVSNQLSVSGPSETKTVWWQVCGMAQG